MCRFRTRVCPYIYHNRRFCLYLSTFCELYWFFCTYGKLKGLWTNLFTTFNLILWAIILISYLLVFIFYFALSNDNISEVIMLTYKILLSLTCKQPKILQLRIIYLAETLVALHLYGTYQGVLLVNLFQRRFEKQIATFEDLAESNIIYGGNTFARDGLNESDSPIFKKLARNYHVCSANGSECYTRLLKGESLVIYKLPIRQ